MALGKLAAAFCAAKFVQLLAVAIAPSQFDESSGILLEQFSKAPSLLFGASKPRISYILDKFVAWDAVYLLKLSLEGITFEHEWVFGPLFWRWLHYTLPTQNVYDVLVVSMALNTLSHLLSCIVLYHLTLRVFSKSMLSSSRADFFATACALLCTIQPAGIFSVVPYAESVSQLLCYLALFLRRSDSLLHYLLSGVCIALAFGFRSNCLLYGIVYLYDLGAALLGGGAPIGTTVAKHLRTWAPLVAGSFVAVALLLATYLPYSEYCPARGAWCDSPTASLVQFAQSYYWNVGFLRYFTLGNLPLFLIAAPQLAILLLSLVYFKAYREIRGEWLVTAVYLFLQFFAMHVQIVNRVSTFVPLHFWYIGSILGKDEPKSKARFLFSRRFGVLVAHWWVIWTTLQANLYGAFLPPA